MKKEIKSKKYVTLIITNKKSALECKGKKYAKVFSFESDVSDVKKIESFLILAGEQIIKFNPNN